MQPSEQILAAQAAYAARPFAVRWCDSHFSATNRMATLDECFEYIQRHWALIQKNVKERQHCASDLSRSYLETPEGRVSLRYVLLCDNVSSY
jgi:hypothetical protein